MTGIRGAFVRRIIGLLLVRDFKNDFKFHRGPQRETGHAIDQTTRVLVFSKDALQQIGSTVSDLRMIADIFRCGAIPTETHNPTHLIKRSQIFSCNRKGVECSKVSGLASCFYIELSANTSYEFCRASLGRQHASKKEQIACL